ncbi:hypothetical protein CBR_g37446 [Chara braunii]|uniref:BRCT domain-containing protein n=1 Tax=Chara braunii TaxID=69332 RepID=A0A388LMX0_CHABU|nr:hypothetical protein CBR_g37446 [Chara braunii]|eukprot:GBG83644.1 hypothetical protein CBR_g37446 [Chara braunii]
MVESMSGTTHKRITESVCYFVSKDVRSDRYKWANDLKIPTISVQWVEQCWSEHRLVAHEDFRLPPFKGLIISATGVSPERRKEIEVQTRAYGGTYSADLTRTCTHLIANSATGNKYKVAIKWDGIKVVSFQWFAQSLVAKGCLDEEKFPVSPGRVGSPLAGAERSKNSSQRLSLNPLGTIVRETPNTVQNLFGVVREEGGIGGVSREGRDHGRTSGGGQRGRKRLAADSDDRRGEQKKRKEEDVLQASDTYGDDDGLDMADDMYLSAFRVHLVGFNKEDMMKWVNMVRDGGGTRFMAFNDMVTHVVVGQPAKR